MFSSSQNYFGVFPVFCGFLKVLAYEQALLEERACNDVSGIFIFASKKSTQNADWWIFKLGAYVIALPLRLVDNTKMVESGISIRESCENFSGIKTRTKSTCQCLTYDLAHGSYFNRLLLSPKQLKGINIKQCWLYPHCKVSLSITRS